jgi:ferredoxin--NADP+ reductase
VTHVVTQSCCSDASCTYACPVNCIHPTPDDPGFLAAEMLYVDPLTCVDCGACVTACPVEAIKPAGALTPAELPFLAINRAFHEARRAVAETGPARPRPILARPPARLQVRRSGHPLRVAVIGSGPSGLYAADELLTIPGAEVTVFERGSEPYGLARFGVAPDHRRTRAISGQFEQIRRARGLALELGVEVGSDVTHDELLERFDAVIYAVGAAADRHLEIPGTELDGVDSATAFVAWYNGHPDSAGRRFDLSGRRAVVIGNGNVGLDVARMLTTDPDRLAETDISPAALAALRASSIEEVVVTSRRGPHEAAFTLPELLGLASAPGVELVWDGSLDVQDTKLAWISQLPPSVRGGSRRVRLAFGMNPVAMTGGDGRLQAVQFVQGPVAAGMALTSVGYAGTRVPGLPFDPLTHTVPNRRGRVIDPGNQTAWAGTYVTGWIKRGPTGFLGTNRSDSQETVRSLIEDFNNGRLGRTPRPVRARS